MVPYQVYYDTKHGGELNLTNSSISSNKEESLHDSISTSFEDVNNVNDNL